MADEEMTLESNTAKHLFDKYHKYIIILMIFLFSFLYIFRFRNTNIFGDETDNFTGGWLISQGYMPYRDFFSHHMPLPYFLSSFLIFLGYDNPVMLRIGMIIITLIFWGIVYYILEENIDQKLFLAVMMAYTITTPMFWGYMLLADVLFAQSIFLAYLIYYRKIGSLDFSRNDIVGLYIIFIIAILSTIVSLIPITLLVIFYIYKTKRYMTFVPLIVIFLLIFSIPYIWFFAFKFNMEYYSIYYKPILGMIVTTVPMWFGLSLLLLNAVYAYILYKKDKTFALFYIIFILSLMIRGSSFHGIPYFLLSIFAGMSVIYYFIQNMRREYINGIMASILILLIISIPYDTGGSFDKGYYDMLIQKYTDSTDKIWIVPAEGSGMYIQNNRLPGTRFLYYYPWIAEYDKKDHLSLQDLEKNKPKMIIWDEQSKTWGYKLSEYGNDTYQYISKRYIRIEPNVYILKDA